MDDDIICLSSDNEDSSQSSQKNPLRNGSQSSSILQMGGSSIPKTDKPQSISNGHSHNGTATSSSTQTVKPKEETENEDIVYLNSDDDSDSETEYSSQGRGQNSNGNGGTQTVDVSDDDDIQVLEENIKVNHQHTPEKLLVKSMNDRKKRTGLTAGVSKKPREKIVDAAVRGASGDGNSTSQDADVIEENVDYKAKSRNSLERFLNEFCARSKERKDCLRKARKKLMDAYGRTLDLNMSIHRRLHERIEHDLDIVRSASGAEEQWKTIAALKVYIKPANLTKDQIKTEDEIKEEREDQKMDLRIKYELELARIQRKIKELEVAEVDWEDDYNSNYMLLEKYTEKWINDYYTLCTLFKCSHLTGRPTQTKITLKKHNAASNYPDIDSQVEKFVNKMGHAPYYTDILKIIRKTNKRKSLGLRKEIVLRTAQKMYDNIVKIFKERRMKDLKIRMLTILIPTPEKSRESSDSNTPSTSATNPSRSDDVDDPEELEKQIQDPADLDPELLAKLEENDKLRKSKSEVNDSFAESIGSNDSAGEEGDNEEDEEYVFQHEELTEDEDDDDRVEGEPPAKRRRADENCNEESVVVTKLVTDSEEIAVVSVPATPLVVKNNSNSLA